MAAPDTLHWSNADVEVHKVVVGHGIDTTIGTEGPHLDEWIERGW